MRPEAWFDTKGRAHYTYIHLAKHGGSGTTSNRGRTSEFIMSAAAAAATAYDDPTAKARLIGDRCIVISSKLVQNWVVLDDALKSVGLGILR